MSPDQLSEWLAGLVASVGMKVLIPPNCVRCDTPGNEGVTGIVCLETSHASIHIWDIGFLQADLYSCKSFGVDAVLDRFNVFGPTLINFTLIDRNDKKTQTLMDGFRLPDADTADIETTQKQVQRGLRLGRITDDKDSSFDATTRGTSATQE